MKGNFTIFRVSVIRQEFIKMAVNVKNRLDCSIQMYSNDVIAM
jgi:hypothetical protein